MKKLSSALAVLFLTCCCCLMLTGCSITEKTVSAETAADNVLMNIIEKYDNKFVKTRHLDFSKTVIYKGNIVFVTYDSENEKSVTNQGVVYPSSNEKTVNVAVKVKSNEYSQESTILIKIPGNEWISDTSENDTSLKVCAVLTGAWSMWDDNNYVTRFEFEIYNNTSNVIKCFAKLDGYVYAKLVGGYYKEASINYTHEHYDYFQIHSTNWWDLNYERELQPGKKATVMVDADELLDDNWLFTNSDILEWYGSISWYNKK